MGEEDLLAVLELKAGASPLEVRTAYRRLVKVWHPDRFMGDADLSAHSTKRLAEINEAYRALVALRGSSVSSGRKGEEKPNRTDCAPQDSQRSADEIGIPPPPSPRRVSWWSNFDSGISDVTWCLVIFPGFVAILLCVKLQWGWSPEQILRTVSSLVVPVLGVFFLIGRHRKNSG